MGIYITNTLTKKFNKFRPLFIYVHLTENFNGGINKNGCEKIHISLIRYYSERKSDLYRK